MLRSFRLPKFRQKNRSSDEFYEERGSLHLAASVGDVDKVRKLLDSGVRVNMINEYGNTALHQAAWNGFSQTVEVLCKHKADVYVKNKDGFSALHLTCQNGHNQSCRILLLAGCKPDIKNTYGDTPFHTAARYGHAGVARILISAHCDVNETNKNGDTALHISVAMGRKKLTQIILNAGCNPFIRNKQKEKPLDITRRKKFIEIEQILIKHMREKNFQGKFGRTNYRFSGTSQGSRESTDKSEQFWIENDWHLKRSSKEFQRYKNRQSPYGCHMFPNPDLFPPIKLNTLPSEPLMKGEQYYVDLAGNIKKGPTGFGHNCYCKPLIKKVEKILEAGKEQVIDCVDYNHRNLNARIENLERQTKNHLNSLHNTIEKTLELERKECVGRYEKHIKNKTYINKTIRPKILELYSSSHHNLGFSLNPDTENKNVPRSRQPILMVPSPERSKSEELLRDLNEISKANCLAASEDNLLEKVHIAHEMDNYLQYCISLNAQEGNLEKLKFESFSERNLTNSNLMGQDLYSNKNNVNLTEYSSHNLQLNYENSKSFFQSATCV